MDVKGNCEVYWYFFREYDRIPYGETRSYGEIAARVGNPKAARVVGDGSLVGFAGGMHVKEFLLHLESTTQVVDGNSQINISGINEPY